MYVCICNAITDHKIKEAVASGANSLTDLKDQLGVATCCGCCADLATSFLTANAGNAHTQLHSSIAVERSTRFAPHRERPSSAFPLSYSFFTLF